MKADFKMDGLKDLEANLKKLKQGTGRGVMRRTIKKAAKPLADLMAYYAPDDPDTAVDDLTQSIEITSRLTRNAKRMARAGLNGSTAVEMFVGPASHAFHGFFQEEGTRHHAPQPFMRPAWEEDKMALAERIKKQLALEIDATLARLAKKG